MGRSLQGLFVLGISTKISGLDTLEQVAIPPVLIPSALQEFKKEFPVNECLILSTCNRVEIFACGSREIPGLQVLTFLERLQNIAGLRNCAHYQFEGLDAARHFMRVMAGLDSIVIGETEIRRQLERSFEAALQSDCVKEGLTDLFNLAMAASIRVHAETAVGQGVVSFPCLALEQLERSIGSLRIQKAAIIGTGKMAEAAVIALRRREVRLTDCVVLSRCSHRSQSFAEAFGLKPSGWESIREVLISSDVAFTATQSAERILDKTLLEEVMQARDGRQFAIIDTAVPRNVDPIARFIPGVLLCNIETLRAFENTTIRLRKNSLPEAEAIIEQSLQSLLGDDSSQDWGDIHEPLVA